MGFLGDICLSRNIRLKYEECRYEIVHSKVKKVISECDFVVGNMESPVSDSIEYTYDHLAFFGLPKMLSEFGFVDFFSVSNNHINDFGDDGFLDTVKWLDYYGFKLNGIFDSSYKPLLYDEDEKIAIITCTDMMNVPFSEKSHYRTLFIDSKELDDVIKETKKSGWFIILYAHVGVLFSRYVNPEIRSLLHKKIDLGVDLIITVHPHCVGGMEFYNDKPIFYSLGDFVMDGNSFRRRRSVMLSVDIIDGKYTGYAIHPVVVNQDYETVMADATEKIKILKSWERVSKVIKKKSKTYRSFFRYQYNFEMLQHSINTLIFLYKRLGLSGVIRIVVLRSEEVVRMLKNLFKDKSTERRDDDAILPSRKKISERDVC